jgi:RNA polymerase I-specific transcription initiation factor RRN7
LKLWVVEIYTATKTLSEYLCQSFAWAHMTKIARSSLWPESRLMAIVIMATKLGFGLDGVQRTPKSSDEPAATPLSWPAWEKFLKDGDMERSGALEIDVTEADVFQMDGEDLDRYMDWYEKTWCPKEEWENRSKCTFPHPESG